MANISDEIYMQRAFDLALKGAGKVSPNPMVGAVLVHEGTIIGEGYHQQYGGPHAEVNAVRSVKQEQQQFIADSTMYVSLEPCCIYGKTPPCTNLILKNGIKRVVIASQDKTPGVFGQSRKILKEAGVEVHFGVLQATGDQISKIRNIFVEENRPYVILKYARNQHGFIGEVDQQVWISNNYSKRLVHRWRGEVDAILVGTNTVLIDNPRLTNRHYFGKQPLRIILDRQLRIPTSAYVFDESTPTLILTAMAITPPPKDNVEYVTIDFTALAKQLFELAYQRNLSTLMIEGGAQILQYFAANNAWNEARVFTGSQSIKNGIPAPNLQRRPTHTFDIAGDRLEIYFNA
ncbi:MAG: bifunctional diaminohydroxyphosphoribosylaminopyrimidine deaminase/5-amino-6-(5-phosphoribosylamino)uracil reductase RibD [Bacteroidota bacterium]